MLMLIKNSVQSLDYMTKPKLGVSCLYLAILKLVVNALARYWLSSAGEIDPRRLWEVECYG